METFQTLLPLLRKEIFFSSTFFDANESSRPVSTDGETDDPKYFFTISFICVTGASAIEFSCGNVSSHLLTEGFAFLPFVFSFAEHCE